MWTDPADADAKMTPEEMLLTALLRQALHDLRPSAPPAARAASRVFLSNGTGGFAAICGALGLDYGDVRGMVEQLYLAPRTGP